MIVAEVVKRDVVKDPLNVDDLVANILGPKVKQKSIILSDQH